MCQPGLESYLALTKEYSLIPVYREVLADLETPISVYLKLCQGEKGAFLLESVEGGEKVAAYSFLGCRPLLTLANRGGISWIAEGEAARQCRLDRPGVDRRKGPGVLTGDPLSHLRQLVGRFKAFRPAELPRFSGGPVGYLGYDAVRYYEELPGVPADDLGLPESFFMVTELVVAFNHRKHKLVLIVNSIPGDHPATAYEQASALLEWAVDRLRRPVPTGTGVSLGRRRPLSVEANLTRPEFEASVRRAKEHILAGDIFQVVLSQRLTARVDAQPLDIYRLLRTVNPSPYMFYITIGDLKIIGASPEMLVRVENGTVNLRPIAGTRPRGATEAEDLSLEADLLADEKERAEHVMLVDLGRNDLGRVCEFGTVTVKEMMRVERYSHVMHIVSDLEGRLRPDADAFAALTACFPAGTLSGAPKVRAMQIIDTLEPTKRGVYGGAIGYFSWDGAMDTCIAIRTIVMQGDQVHIQAGAGIVADSDPTLEYQESLNKARALLQSLEMVGEGLA
ncbi:MAG TPA: anthranilate synthase component I [Bacillota bacterium]|jgi:anthranilate synthase component 1